MNAPSRRLVVEAAAAAVALGIAAGLVWSALAPEIVGEVTDDGVVVRFAQARHQFGVTAWFVVVTAIAGIVHGTAVVLRQLTTPVAALFAVTATGALGTVLAWRVGVFAGPDPVDDRPAGLDAGSPVTMPLELTSWGPLLIWPIAAVAAAAVVVAVKGARRTPPGEISPNDRSEPSSPT